MEQKNYLTFYTPSNIYIPYDSIEKLNLRKSNIVYYGEILGKLNTEVNIFSTASGLIRGTSKVESDNKMINALVIENDYKDKPFKIVGGKERFDIYKRKEANEILDNFNIPGKYNGKKYLMIDLLIKNNHLENRILSLEYHYELLETIDALMTIYSLDKAYIAINDNISEEVFNRYFGIYPNIKFINRVKKNDLCVNYTGYEVLRIYNALKFNKFLSEKFVTIFNNKEIRVIKTKNYILVSEILNNLNIKSENVSVITYNDEKISNYKGIINENIKSIIIS